MAGENVLQPVQHYCPKRATNGNASWQGSRRLEAAPLMRGLLWATGKADGGVSPPFQAQAWAGVGGEVRFRREEGVWEGV